MPDQTSTPYTLHFINGSRNAWSFCVYMTEPDTNVLEVQTLTWLTVQAAPTTNVAVSWTLDYGFVWMQTGTLAHGHVKVSSSQTWPGDLEQKNSVTYTTRNGLPTFVSPAEGPNPGSLYIHQDRRVRPDKSVVGITVSGLPAFTVPAQPNVDLVFTPAPEYWITFGKYEQSAPLDLTEVTNPRRVVFEPNCHSMVARLNADNLWAVEPSENQ